MTERRTLKVMFLCTANSCRSQMAEGFARQLGRDILEPYSAGLFSLYVHPRAKEVMKETGIDISSQRSTEIDDTLLRQMDMVITLCDHAEKTCPAVPPGVERMHWPIRDPVGTVGTEQEIMSDFRRARDEIRRKIEGLLEQVQSSPNNDLHT